MKIKNTIRFILAFVTVFVFGYKPVLGQAAIQNEDMVSKLGAVINKAVELELFSGVVLVAKEGKILFSKAYGEANKDFHIKNTLDTKFNIASGTKPFTSVAIMLLVQKGLLSISDPVIKYLPDFPFGDKITLFHLLTHTSGLGHYTAEYTDKMHSVRGFASFLKQFIYKEKLLFEPGTKFGYSNSGVVVLGAIIEKISGKNYAEFLQQNIFTPLHMKNTCSKMPEEIIESRASGYQKKLSGKFVETSLSITPPTSATGLRTTVLDLYTFIQAVHENKLLKEEYKKIMFTPYLSDNSGPYALLWNVLDGGLFIKSDNKVIGHTGGQPGFITFYFHYVKDNITIITLSNYGSNYTLYRPIEAIVFGKEYEMPKIAVDVSLYSLMKKAGPDEFFKNISEILEKNKLVISSPGILNNAGYNLLSDGDLETAINFFRLNVELFKDDANGYDSLAEAYLNAGHKELAIQNYEKSLALNPQNANASEQIKKLREIK